jgi:hypothetical protein
VWNVLLGLNLITGAGSAKPAFNLRNAEGKLLPQVRGEDEHILQVLREFLNGVSG